MFFVIRFLRQLQPRSDMRQGKSMRKASEEYIVNAQSGKSFRVQKGDSIRIIDIEGKQVADFWAIRDDHLDEFFSPGVTLDSN